MHFAVDARTILLVRHGSHAYGLNTPVSDEDFKGVCIKPKECYLGFTQRFEQMEHMGSKSDGVDKVVYSLDKFAKLAADCNPNIIEVLHVADSDVLKSDEFGDLLREHRYDFLSKKAKFTFSGYAHAQLKRIKSHKAWMFDPPKAPPTREQFGLSDKIKVSESELGAFKALIGDDQVDLSMLASYVSNETFLERLMTAFQYVFGRRVRPENVVTLFTRERAFRSAMDDWDSYQEWVKNRNPDRAVLEAKFGYDTKHGMHLLRLMKMCKEILMTGKVNVKRIDDREELLGVRNGELAYDDLIYKAERLEAECDALYPVSTLRKEPDRAAIDALIIDMTERYLRQHG